MKNYMYLEWHVRHYYAVAKTMRTNLKFLVNFFAEDYRDYYKDMYYRVATAFNINFVYNDFKTNDMYVGFSEWSISDGEMHCPENEEFKDYVNETNSCKINQDNFIELAANWMEMKKNQTPFAIIYRDDNDWVYCKGFDSKGEMELFVTNYEPEVTH